MKARETSDCPDACHSEFARRIRIADSRRPRIRICDLGVGAVWGHPQEMVSCDR